MIASTRAAIEANESMSLSTSLEGMERQERAPRYKLGAAGLDLGAVRQAW
jgi:hypothetical protein